MKRSASNPNLAKSGASVPCYGVSQGYYAVKTGVVMGTSSLGSCFALIAKKGASVFFAHVQAGTTAQSLIDAINGKLGAPDKVLVVRGAGYSDTTEELIGALKQQFAVEESSSNTATVVFDPFSGLSTPGNISPTNNQRYLGNNLKGGSQKSGSPILPMDD